MQLSKSIAFGAVAITLHGCGDKEDVKPKTQTQEFLAKLDKTEIKNAVEQATKKLLRTAQFRPAVANLVTTVSGVVPDHSQVDALVKQAMDLLHSFEGNSNDAVKEAYEFLHKQIKDLKIPDAKSVDDQAHKMFSDALDAGHKTVLESLKAAAKDIDIDQTAKNMEKLLKDNLGVEWKSQKAVTSGMELINSMAAHTIGVEKNVADYVDQIHLDGNVLSQLGLQEYAGVDLKKVEKEIRKQLGEYIEKAQDGLKGVQKEANKALEHRVEYIKKAEKAAMDLASQAETGVKQVVQDVVKQA